MSIRWYDRKGELIQGTELDPGDPKWIEAMRRVEKLLRDREYVQIAKTDLPDGGRVSTVWLGLDHNYLPRATRILIFETMVFNRSHSTPRVLDMHRYSTEDEAQRGHTEMVEKWFAKVLEPVKP